MHKKESLNVQELDCDMCAGYMLCCGVYGRSCGKLPVKIAAGIGIGVLFLVLRFQGAIFPLRGQHLFFGSQAPKYTFWKFSTAPRYLLHLLAVCFDHFSNLRLMFDFNTGS